MKESTKKKLSVRMPLAKDRVLLKLAERPLMASDFSMSERSTLRELEDEGRVHYHDGLWHIERG